MKQLLKYGIVVFLVVGIIFGTINVFANSSNGKKIVLNEKYNSKKIDRIVNSIKQKNNYRFLISSNETLDNIEAFFVNQDKKVKIKQYGENTFMIRLSKNSSLLTDLIADIDNGILPTKIGGYDIIQPEIVEGLGYLDGEEIDKLWGNNLIGAGTFQEELMSKQKVKVAILDTGIDYNNPELDDNYNSIISYDFVNEDNDAMDDNGHGTSIAGIIGAEVNGTGRYGVNSNSDLISLKVLDSNGIGTTYDILEAIEYAKLNNIKVLNLSFGGIGDASTSVICDAITDAKANGIYTITSAGNNASSIQNLIPASCNDSIAVGSIDLAGEKATFSNYGTGVIYAPGVDIYTTGLNNTYKTVSGTSFSAGFVSGLISKELAYSGGICYDDLVENVKNDYSLIKNEQINIEKISLNTYEDIKYIHERFNDFKYLSNNENYIYYSDKIYKNFIYKLPIDFLYIYVSSNGYIENGEYMFSNKNNFDYDYFSSGQYITIEEYFNENGNDSNLFTIDSESINSMGEYEINHKFVNSSGIQVGIYSEYFLNEGGYLYYRNNNDSYKIYRIKNDGSEVVLGGTKIVDVYNTIVSYNDEQYLYYRNRLDNYNLYRAKKDGSDISTGGIKVYNVSNSSIMLIEGGYVYYRNYDDSKKIYKANLDGSDVLTGGTKISEIENARIISSDNEYVYYRDYDVSWKIYKAKKDGSDVLTGGVKVLDVSTSQILFEEGNYIYYSNKIDYDKIYKANKDGSDALTGGIKISDTLYTIFLFEEGDYIYVRNGEDQYKIYKLKKEGTDVLTGGIKIYDFPSPTFISNQSEYIYFYIRNNGIYSLVKIKKDGSDILTGGIKIVDVANTQILQSEEDYIYYRNIYDNYNLYRIKTDGSEIISGGTKIIDVRYVTITFNQEGYIYYANRDDSGKFYRIKNDGTDSNYKQTDGIYISPKITLNQGQEFLKIGIDADIPLGTDYKIYLSKDNINYIEINKSELDQMFELNSVFGEQVSYIYLKIQLIGDTNDNTKTPVVNSIRLSSRELPQIFDLNQKIKTPYGYSIYKLSPGGKVGRYESGTGIILGAQVINENFENFRLVLDITKLGDNIHKKLLGGFSDSSTLNVTVPYSGTGSYSWKARIEDTEGNIGDWIKFGTGEYDYLFYDGYEPYPYGYNFKNSGLEPGILTNSDKWEIFYKIFPKEKFSSMREIISAYKDIGLDKPTAFFNGNCFGLSLSSLMYKYKPITVYNFEPNFYDNIISGKIREDINISIGSNGLWNEYNDITRTIFEYQLAQYFRVYQDTKKNSIIDGNFKILENLKTDLNSNYLLSFNITASGSTYTVGHSVVPYKVEGNKIYIWDSNIPYSNNNGLGDLSYSTYIEVESDNEFSYTAYDDDYILSDLALVNVDVFENNNLPIGYNDTDILYTLSGSSDIIVSDTEGRLSGFSGGTILKEIPGVNVIIPSNFILGSDFVENSWKQIYLSEKQDLEVRIIGKNEEKYNLMIAGGNYHTDIENVNTSSGEIDIFVSQNNNLKIDFDDNKKGEYNLLFDNYQENNTGYIDIIEPIINNLQNFNIIWENVENNENDSVLQEIDLDNDGIYSGTGDILLELPPIFYDNLSPTTNYIFSGTLAPNTLGSIYLETVTIELDAFDNSGGIGVDKIYYSLDNNTGALLYLPYEEPIVVNGVNDFTLHYYSKDKLGNIEEVKIVNFTLIEIPETYSGNISGYVYDDNDENGIQDDGEKFMAGWKICIDLNNNNECEEQSEPFNLTNNDGYYEFDSLITGQYKILEIPHQNWETTNNNGYYEINLSNGEVVSDINFGNYKSKIK